MRVLLAILVLITTLPCDGQVRRRVLGPKPGGGGITLPAGIAFRWIATNLFDPVTNWTDIVSGYSWTNSTAFPRFTNGQGVYFTSPNMLYATNKIFATNQAILIVLKTDSVTNNYGKAVFSDVASSAIFSFVYNQWTDGVNQFGCALSNVVYDVFYNFIAGGGGGLQPQRPYTNGVFVAGTSASGMLDDVVAKIGGVGAVKWTGALYEYIIWTNSLGFTSTDLANIHKYATNRWGFSP